MFESMTSAGAVEKVPVSGEVNAKIEAWSNEMERCAKKCAERNCELANKGIEQFFSKPSHLVPVSTSSRKRSWKR